MNLISGESECNSVKRRCVNVRLQLVLQWPTVVLVDSCVKHGRLEFMWNYVKNVIFNIRELITFNRKYL